MLVLTRRIGEKIVIGNDVVVTVLEVRSDQVRIGIEAPRSVQVHREEVHAQIAAANSAAVAAAAQTRAVLRQRPPRPPAPRDSGERQQRPQRPPQVQRPQH